MKPIVRFIALAFAVLLLASCSKTPAATQTPPQTQPAQTAEPTTPPPAGTSTAAPTESPSPAPAETTAAPEPTYTSVPLPTAGIIPDLPDPAGWQPSLRLDPKDYPRVDGSTANLPLGVYMRAKLTGESLSACTAATKFTTTGPSYIALAEKRADLLVVYEAPEEVKQQLKDMGAKLTQQPIGMDALVFLTNKGNPVEGLTHQQIIDVYTGKIKNWKQLGGEDIDIIPYQRISNSGSQALMLKLVMKGTKMMEAPEILQPSEMGELIDDLASYDNTKNALGYSVFYYVRNMYKVPGIKLLSVNGVKPEPETIASEEYPYVNPFYAVIREDEPKDSPAHKLFDWLTGAEGKRAVQDAGYVASK